MRIQAAQEIVDEEVGTWWRAGGSKRGDLVYMFQVVINRISNSPLTHIGQQSHVEIPGGKALEDARQQPLGGVAGIAAHTAAATSVGRRGVGHAVGARRIAAGHLLRNRIV